MPRRRGLVALLLAAASAALASVVLGGMSADGTADTSGAAAGPRVPTAVVTREDLQTTTVVDGVYTSATPVTVHHRSAAGGTRTLTQVPSVGSVIRRGEILYRADQRPVVLLYGRVPAYRTLRRGLVGADVRELQENLLALGVLGRAPDGHFGTDTKLAVQAWQRVLGIRPSGRVPLGMVVVAPGARRVAAGGSAVGTLLSDGTTICPLTAVGRRVRVPLSADQRAFASEGGKATVTLPDRSQTTGKIVSVGPAAAAEASAEPTAAADQAGAGGGGGGGGPAAAKPAYEARVRLPAGRRTRALADGSTVSVTLTRTIRRDALVVPVTALAARPGGGFQVRVVRSGRTTPTTVRVGAFANGLAEVVGAVREGDHVVVPAGP